MDTQTGSHQGKPLSAEEKNTLAERYLSMVYLVANDIRQRLPVNVDFNDLVSAGQWGLVQALEKYEADRETRFITYAKHRIRGAILDELRRLDPVGRSTRSRIKHMEEAKIQLRHKLGREPEMEEVSEMVPLKKSQLERTQVLPMLLSLEQDSVGNESIQVPDTMFGSVFDHACQNQSADRIEGALKMLTPTQQQIIRLYYLEGMTLSEMAAEMGTPESNAWQARTQALHELRQAFVVSEQKRTSRYVPEIEYAQAA